MELYIAFNIDKWGSYDLFDYINGVDKLLALVPESVKKPTSDLMELSSDRQLALMYID